MVAMAAGAGAGIAGLGAGRLDDTPPNPIILGSGAHRYECQHDWLKAPAGTAFGDTHGLAQSADGTIFLAHTVGAGSTNPDGVCVYDASGKFLNSWGTEFAGGAHGLDLRREGEQEFLYHCDTRRRCVQKTDLAGTTVWTAQCPMQSGVYESADRWCPTNVAFHPEGDVLVADGYGSSFVHRFGADGQWKSVVIKPGSPKGEVSCPHGLWVDTRGGEPRLVVADRGNRRIQIFDLDGKPVAVHTSGVRMPCDMHFREGVMLVPDLESVVTLYDERNEPIVSLGDGHPTDLRGKPPESFVPGKFVHPHDAIFLADGSILVAEWVPCGRVTRLAPLPA